MALSCDRLNLNIDHCAVNYSPSRESCQPLAFVLHGIPHFTTEEYIAFSKEKFLRGRDYVTDYPKSVHYLIGDNNVIYQLVELHDRAWGVAELKDPSWPLLNQCAWSDHEDLFIHIGFIGATPSHVQLNLASEIMCCIIVSEPSINIQCNEYGIIVARDLNIDLDCLWSVPDSIIPKVQVCVQQGGKDPFFVDDIGTYGKRISDLEAWKNETSEKLIDLEVCCCQNRDAIAALETTVAELQATVDDINVESLELQISDLEEGNLAAQQRLQIIEDCLTCNNLCGAVRIENVVYRLDSSSPVKLVPGSIQVINLPVKISDTSPVPIVSTGPLWYANLQEEVQTSCNKFEVEFTARLSNANWCADRTLEAYAIINSQNVLLDTYEATAGNQTATVSGSTTFNVPPDTVVQVGLKTTEDLEPLEVSMATVVIRCLDGVISPNCRECGPC